MNWMNIIAILSNILAFMTNSLSLGLIILLVAVFIEVVLISVVLRNNKRSATNIIFALLSVTTILWLVAAYIVHLPQLYLYAVLLARLGIFFAAPMSSLFFLLAYTIPDERLSLKPAALWSTIVATALMMALNISPYAFTNATRIVNGSINPAPGWGLIPFAALSTFFSIFAVYLLIKKFRISVGDRKDQMKVVLIGMVIMLVLIIATILVPIVIFSSGAFVIFTPIYTLVFLGMTAYAIVKYKLFDIKVIATEALTVAIWITLFANIFVANGSAAISIGVLVFVATVILGAILMQSVRREVRQREELQRLNEKVQANNKELAELGHFKSELLSLASHQIRSPLAAMKGFISLIIGGAYGPVEPKVKETLGKVQGSADELIGLINTLLDVRKVEEGKMEYQFEKIDLKEMIAHTVDLVMPLAQAKNLALTADLPSAPVMVNIDKEKFKQVIQNLIDNAIKYTPSGFVRVALLQEGTNAIVTVNDSGLGIPATLIPFLFEEFIRDERVKKEIRGTGLGLYIARKITEAHGGKLSAESPGEGKGSTFKITIPVHAE
jgi:signal transduction histidine kinase